MEKILQTPGLFVIRDQIFGYLTHNELKNCRRAWPDYWDESLERSLLVKYLHEFGERLVYNYDWQWHPELEKEFKKFQTVFPGWNKAVKKVGTEASIEDLKEIKTSLWQLLRGRDGKTYCIENPMHQAVMDGAVKLMKLLMETSFIMSVADASSLRDKAIKWRQFEIAELIKDKLVNLEIDNWKRVFEKECQEFM